MKHAIVLLLSACAAGTAFARSEDRRDPIKPEASVPSVTYRSAFADYRPYREQEISPWREVNDEVARVGGHAGVLKKPMPHGGHR
jgi:hypothetical protein